MKKLPSLLPFIAPLLISLWCPSRIQAQGSPVERRFANPKAEVDQAVQELQSSFRGRLPILEGFVEATNESFDHFERGYYQCLVQVIPDSPGGTLVRVTAKITAWYADPNPAQAGYRVLPSNGRLETDLLDRVEERLRKKTAAAPAAPKQAAPAQPSAEPSQSSNLARPRVTADVNAANPLTALRSAPAGAPAPPPSSDEDLTSLKQQRKEAERRMKELGGDLQALEQIRGNQAHPDNLAVVRKSGTPVLSKPQPAAHVLFSAEAQDEFEILGKEGTWVHVQVSGASRGWIRRADLDLPDEAPDRAPDKAKDKPAKEVLPAGSAQPAFRVIREETHLFTGSWQELRGKTVRIIWAEPASTAKTSSALAKRNFAKSLFAQAYQEVSSADQLLAGVVVVFDSADGGQISATLSNLAQWQAGHLSEAAFWKQCSLDPPELLQDSGKP